MKTEQETQTTDLIIVPPKETALAVFSAESGLDPYMQTIRAELDNFKASPPNLATATGRKAYASMAHKIARSKVAIDNLGKDLVAELKEMPRKVDAERKRWRDTLDLWRDEARRPLDEWEDAEEKRIAAHNAKIELIESWAATEDIDGNRLSSACLKDALTNVEGVKLGEEWEEFEAKAARVKDFVIESLKCSIKNQERHEAEQAELERLRKEQAEREQKEREERIAREAAERKEREHQEALVKAQVEAEMKQRRAEEEQKRKEIEHKEALAKAKHEAEQEQKRIEAEHKRKEDERLEEQRRETEEYERRQADKKHKANINRAAAKALTVNGIREEEAKKIVILIANGLIPSVTINY